MTNEPRWRRYLRFWHRNVESDIDDELAFHFEQRIHQFMAAGATRDEAVVKAGAHFGDLSAVRAHLIGIGGRIGDRSDRTRVVDGVRQDLMFAVRVLRQRRLATAIIVATLGMAIGANTAMFSVVSSVLWHPIAGRAVDRLVVVRDEFAALGTPETEIAVGEALDLIAARDVFRRAAGVSTTDRYLSADGDAQRVVAAATIGPFFDVFGLRPGAGQFYSREISDSAASRVAVLSYAAWQRVFGGDSGIVGRQIDVDGTRYRVVGVGPRAFDFPRGVDLWMPQAIVPGSRVARDRGMASLTFVARPVDGLSLSALRKRLWLESRRWEDRYGPEWYPKSYRRGMLVHPLTEFLAGQIKPISIALMCAVMAVLLIACVNVTGLQMVRMTARRREIAIRVALGASAGDVARLLSVEALLLGGCGASAGLIVAYGLLATIRRSAVLDQTVVHGVGMSTSCVVFNVVIAVGAMLVVGILPALRLAFIDGTEAWRGAPSRATSRPRGERIALDGAVLVQFALALALVASALVTVSSVRQLLAVDPGFRPEGVVAAEISVPSSRYPGSAAKAALHSQLIERMRALPGVQAVGTAYGLPFSGLGTSTILRLTNKPPDPTEPDKHTDLWFVGGDYFATLGIPLLRGRQFDDTDVPGGPPVVIVDAAFAKQLFPNEDPIGKQVGLWRVNTIIGVVGSVKYRDVSDSATPAAYYSYRQYPGVMRTMSIVVRSTRAEQTLEEMRAAMHDVDRTIALMHVSTMVDRVSGSMGSRRLAGMTLGAFAGAATLLALLGIYGMLSFATAQRTREIGIRLALGADSRMIARLVLRRGVQLAVAGVCFGVLLFLWSAQLLAAFLFRVEGRSPATIAGSAAGLVGVAILGSWLPARRAARVAPVDLIRVV